jgi:hypothetical protein
MAQEHTWDKVWRGAKKGFLVFSVLVTLLVISFVGGFLAHQLGWREKPVPVLKVGSFLPRFDIKEPNSGSAIKSTAFSPGRSLWLFFDSQKDLSALQAAEQLAPQLFKEGIKLVLVAVGGDAPAGGERTPRPPVYRLTGSVGFQYIEPLPKFLWVKNGRILGQGKAVEVLSGLQKDGFFVDWPRKELERGILPLEQVRAGVEGRGDVQLFVKQAEQKGYPFRLNFSLQFRPSDSAFFYLVQVQTQGCECDGRPLGMDYLRLFLNPYDGKLFFVDTIKDVPPSLVLMD